MALTPGDNLGTLTLNIGVNDQGLLQVIDTMEKVKKEVTAKTLSITQALNKASVDFQRFGYAASFYMTAPLVGLGLAAIKAASSYEKASQKVVALAGITQNQMEEWQGTISNISNKTARPMTELADALYFIASAGIRGKEAMEVLDISAMASATSMGSTDVIARILTSALNAYGISNLSAAEAGDVLTATIREAHVPTESLISAFSMILPVAADLGVTFNQLGGALAALTRTGFSASMASTALRQVMMVFEKPSHGAQQAIKDIHLSFYELRKEIITGGLLSALVKIKNGIEQYGGSAAEIFGNVRALTGELSLMGSNMKSNIAITKELTSVAGDLKAAFNIMAQTMSFKMEQAKTAINSAFIELGMTMRGPLLEAMNDVTEKVRELTAWWKRLSDTTHLFIVHTAEFIAVLGPLSLMIAGFMKILAGTVSTIAFVSGALGTLFSIVGTVLEANPWIRIATGVAMLGGVLYDQFANTEKNNTALLEYNKLLDKSAELAIIASQAQRGIKTLDTMSSSDIKSYKESIREKLDAEIEFTNNIAAEIEKRTAITKSSGAEFVTLPSNDPETANKAAKNQNELNTLGDMLSYHSSALKMYKSQLVVANDYEKKQQDILKLEQLKKQEDEDIKKIFAKYHESLSEINVMTKLWGDSTDINGKHYDAITAKATALKTIVEELAKKDPGNSALKGLASELKEMGGGAIFSKLATTELGYELEKINNKSANLGGSFTGTKEKIDLYTKAIADAAIRSDVADSYISNLVNTVGKLQLVSIDENLSKSLAGIAMESEFLGGKYDSLTSKLNVHKTAFDNQIKLYQEKKSRMSEDEDATERCRLEEEALIISTLELEQANYKYKESLREIDAISSLNKEMDTRNEKINATKHFIEQLTKAQLNNEETTVIWAETQNLINNLKGDVKILQEAKFMEAYTNSIEKNRLAHLRRKNTITDQMQDLTDQINANKKLLADNPEGNSKTKTALTNQINVDTTKLEHLSNMRKAFTDINKALEIGQKLMQGVGTLIEANEARAIRSAENQAKTQGRSEAWLAAEKDKIQKEYGRKKKALAIAEAGINIAVGVTKTFGEQGFTPWAIAEAIALAAAGAMQIAAISSAPMAQGGIVPGGYPNDSYPARLTSGEMVIPPGKLPSLVNNKNNQMNFKPVTFKIGERELVGVLEMATTINKSF